MRAWPRRLCDSAWSVRCTPARLDIATTITEDPIVPSPQSRCRWSSNRIKIFRVRNPAAIRDRIPTYRHTGARPAGNFVRNSRIPKRAPRAGAGARRYARPRTPAPARTGEARSKPGLVCCVATFVLRWNPSRRGPSPRRAHTVSSHAGAGRGPGRAAGAPRGYGGAVNRCPFE